ncbi:MAG TPA: DUF2911 domain-containing protein [Vicinamibacteria bacterium]
MRTRWAFAAAAALAAASAMASTRGAATATVGGKKVAIDYGRPSLKGRPLGDLIKQLSPDRVWRAGDDQVTTLTTETDLDIGGKKVKAGKYSVYVHLPEDGSRNLILNTDLGQPLKTIFAAAPPNLANEPWPYIGNYQAKIADKEVLRVPLKKETAAAPADMFTVDLAQAGTSAKLKLSWGDESWSADLNPAK